MIRALFIIAILQGCASSPYWVKTHEPAPVREVVYVGKPCGQALMDGCANRFTGVIQIRLGMPSALAWCVEQHERKHMAGYSHPATANRIAFATDCGNGEKL